MVGQVYDPSKCIFIATQALNANQFDPNVPDSGNQTTHNLLFDTVAKTLIWVDTKTNIIVQETAGSRLPFGNDTGIADAYQTSIAGATLTDGYTFEFRPTNTNTGASTLQVNALGVLPLVDSEGDPLVNGLFEAGSIYLIAYNATLNKYQMLGPAKPGGIGGSGTLYRIAMFTPDGANIGDSTITFLPESNPGEGHMYLYNATTQVGGSNAGIQYSSTRANRAQLRVNAFGNNAGVAGMTSFKSRGLAVGDLAPVQVGDSIYRVTAIGVTGNNSIPLGAQIDFVVSAVPPGQAWIGIDYAISNTSKNGPANGRRNVFRVDSEGVPHLFEATVVLGQPQDGTAGLVTLDAAGTATITNANVNAASRFNLTVQDGGAVPSGSLIYQSARVNGTSFTITSKGGALDAGVQVYWQMFEPNP